MLFYCRDESVKKEGCKSKHSLKRSCERKLLLFSSAAVTCPALSAPPNGARQGCTGTITEPLNTVCLFSCSPGFNGHGSTTRTCLVNGSWSGQDFVCQGNYKYYERVGTVGARWSSA